MTTAEMTLVEPAASALVPVAAASPDTLLTAAVQQGASLETIERLLALKERYDATEARKAYVRAMAAFKAEPMVINKAKTVRFANNDGSETSYSHAELSDVTAVVVPAMAKHGLSHRWNVSQSGGQVEVTCITTHELGHSEEVVMIAAPDNSGKKNAIQQVASTVSYLQRYTLLAATGMATTGMDDDGQAGGSPETDRDINQAWIDAIDGCDTAAELNSRKKECVKAFGAVEKVPPALIARFTERAGNLAKVKGN